MAFHIQRGHVVPLGPDFLHMVPFRGLSIGQGKKGFWVLQRAVAKVIFLERGALALESDTVLAKDD